MDGTILIGVDGVPVIVSVTYPEGTEIPIGIINITDKARMLEELGDGIRDIGEYIKTGKKPPGMADMGDVERAMANPNIN